MICATLERDDGLDDLYFGGDAPLIGRSRHQSPGYRPKLDATEEELGYVEVQVPHEGKLGELGTD